ncbi:MAG: hypothetical protein H0U50_07290 [Pyrinomonadaceae bacterium]|nr:hypothetical protein [Pyrinomonadaceae bacterium]
MSTIKEATKQKSVIVPNRSLRGGIFIKACSKLELAIKLDAAVQVKSRNLMKLAKTGGEPKQLAKEVGKFGSAKTK